MTDTARHFCVTAIVVAVVTLVAGIAVAVDAIAASQRCRAPVETAAETAASCPPAAELVSLGLRRL